MTANTTHHAPLTTHGPPDWPVPRSVRLAAGGLLGAYWVGLFVLMHTPVRVPVEVTGADKIAHFVCYAGLSLLLAVWGATAGPLTWRRVGRYAVVLAAYGVIDELLQIPVGRSCETADWVADMLGAATGLGAAMLFQRLVLHRTRWAGGGPGALRH